MTTVTMNNTVTCTDCTLSSSMGILFILLVVRTLVEYGKVPSGGMILHENSILKGFQKTVHGIQC